LVEPAWLLKATQGLMTSMKAAPGLDQRDELALVARPAARRRVRPSGIDRFRCVASLDTPHFGQWD
jgi:hypothetical protein